MKSPVGEIGKVWGRVTESRVRQGGLSALQHANLATPSPQ